MGETFGLPEGIRGVLGECCSLGHGRSVLGRTAKLITGQSRAIMDTIILTDL